jgi:2-(1,2-epoxy-1,2-dihydrophenyl)acetyl-CoA isomerase
VRPSYRGSIGALHDGVHESRTQPGRYDQLFLPRRIGIGRAIELVLLNRTLSAGEALDWGIANRVVADASLAEEAHSTAAQLAAGPTRAYGAAKRLMHAGFTEGLETRIEMELRSIAAMARTEDAREAIAAFGAKRAPVFTGR